MPMPAITMPLRIDSLIYLVALWTSNVVLPGALGLAGATFILWNEPGSWSLGLIFPAILCLFAFVCFRFVQSIATSVILESAAGSLTVGKQRYPVDGTEICELKRKPNLAFLQLTLKDGTRVRVIPTFGIYYEIKAEGAQQWWRNKNNHH